MGAIHHQEDAAEPGDSKCKAHKQAKDNLYKCASKDKNGEEWNCYCSIFGEGRQSGAGDLRELPWLAGPVGERGRRAEGGERRRGGENEGISWRMTGVGGLRGGCGSRETGADGAWIWSDSGWELGRSEHSSIQKIEFRNSERFRS